MIDRRTWDCPCGATNASEQTTCEFCGGARPARAESMAREGGCSRCDEVRRELRREAPYTSPQHCARCGEHSPSTMPFHPGEESADPQDRGVTLCPSCWIPALTRRAARDPISDEDRAQCMATIRRACAQIEARSPEVSSVSPPGLRVLPGGRL